MTPVPMALDGAHSEARLFEAGQGPALLVVPAMGVNARGYDRLGEALASLGVTTLVSELRGGDSSSVRARRGVDYGYAELIDDTLAHVAWLRAQGHAVVNVLGHSLGGQLSTVSLARWHQPGAKLVLIGSGTVHYRAYTGLERWRVLAGTQFAGVVARGLGYFPGHRLGFGGLQARSLITDWSNASRTGEFRSARHGPLEQRLDTFEPDVLAIHVLGDDMAPRSATEALVRKLPRARVTWAEVSAPPEPAKLNPHFRWMKAPAAAAERIAAFLR